MTKLMTAAALAATLFIAPAAAAPSYGESMTAAGKAFQSEDWPALNDALDAAQEARPYSLYAYRNRILARMLDGRNDDALALAEKAAARGLVLDLAGHPAFEDLAALPGFAAVAGRMESNAAPVGAPQAVRAFEDSELLPEAIAFGRKGALYIGGVRNGAILSAAKKASSLSTLATAPGGVFDLEARDRTIWAAVNNQLAYEGASGETPFAAIMVFDAKSGDTLRDIRIVEENALLGDLEVAKDGAAYASDSITPRLFRLAPSGDLLDTAGYDAAIRIRLSPNNEERRSLPSHEATHPHAGNGKQSPPGPNHARYRRRYHRRYH